jgi:hypothetical protein
LTSARVRAARCCLVVAPAQGRCRRACGRRARRGHAGARRRPMTATSRTRTSCALGDTYYAYAPAPAARHLPDAAVAGPAHLDQRAQWRLGRRRRAATAPPGGTSDRDEQHREGDVAAPSVIQLGGRIIAYYAVRGGLRGRGGCASRWRPRPPPRARTSTPRSSRWSATRPARLDRPVPVRRPAHGQGLPALEGRGEPGQVAAPPAGARAAGRTASASSPAAPRGAPAPDAAVGGRRRGEPRHGPAPRAGCCCSGPATTGTPRRTPRASRPAARRSARAPSRARGR